MKQGGLVEVANPSEVFLEERLRGATVSSVVSLEGTRPILVGDPALVTPTAFGNAKRTTTGLDHNRGFDHGVKAGRLLLIRCIFESGRRSETMNRRLTFQLQSVLFPATVMQKRRRQIVLLVNSD